MTSAFLRAFNEAYNTGNQVAKDFAIARLSGDQGEEVNTPDLTGNGQTGSLDQQDTPVKKGIKFLGQIYDPADKEKISEARQMALAGIYQKYGDAETANRITSSINQNKLAKSQIKQAEAQDRQTKRAEDLQAKSDLVNQDVADYTQKYTSNPDGSQRQLNYDDQLHLGQYRASKLVSAGLLDEANKLAAQNMSFAANKIQIESAERDKSLGEATAAAASGDLTGIQNFYNKFIPDGAQTTNIVTGKDGKVTIQRIGIDGKKLPDHTFKDVNELVAAAQSISKPDALYNYANNEFHKNIQKQQLGVSQASLSLQQHQSQVQDALRAREIRKEEDFKNSAVGLYNEQNPGASEAKLAAVRSGVLPVVANKGQFKVDGNEITQLLGTPAVDQRGNPITDPLTGKQYVNRSPDREAEFFRFMKDNNINDSNQAITLFLSQKASQQSKPSNAADATAQAKAAISAGASKDAVNKRLREMGYPEIK